MVADSRAPLRTDRLRALNAPVAVEVASDATGVPQAVARRPRRRWGTRGRRAAPIDPPVPRRVIAVVDSWRLDDEWWREPLSRRYFEIVLDDGTHLVVFQDLASGEWFLQQP